MTDYIKRDDAIKSVCDRCVSSKCYSACNSCKERHRIEAIPAADVEEVRHGYYQAEADGYADGVLVYDMWYCSECGHYFEDYDEKPAYSYCPYCGARMDEVTR